MVFDESDAAIFEMSIDDIVRGQDGVVTVRLTSPNSYLCEPDGTYASEQEMRYRHHLKNQVPRNIRSGLGGAVVEDATPSIAGDRPNPSSQESPLLAYSLSGGSVGHNGEAMNIHSMNLTVYKGFRASDPGHYRAHVEMRVSGNVGEDVLRAELPTLCTRLLSVTGGFHLSQNKPTYVWNQMDI